MCFLKHLHFIWNALPNVSQRSDLAQQLLFLIFQILPYTKVSSASFGFSTHDKHWKHSEHRYSPSDIVRASCDFIKWTKSRNFAAICNPDPGSQWDGQQPHPNHPDGTESGRSTSNYYTLYLGWKSVKNKKSRFFYVMQWIISHDHERKPKELDLVV